MGECGGGEEPGMTYPNAQQLGHIYNDAYMLMWYVCGLCGHKERIWNSRDGITPFATTCPSCGKLMQHARWDLDTYAPDHQPLIGQRYWRDGTPDEAAEIMRRRIENMRAEYPLTDDEAAELVEKARNGEGDFRPGWPRLAIRTTGRR